MLLMATEIRPTNLGDAVQVAPAVLVVPEDPAELAAWAELVGLVVPVVLAVLVVPDDPVALAVRAVSAVPDALEGLAVRVALVVLENPVELVVPENPVELVVPENPVELAVQEVLVAPGNPAVPVALVVPAVLVVLENPAGPEELIVLVAVLVQKHRLALLAVALRTRLVIAAHHPDRVPLLAVGGDLVAAVVEITREPAAAEADTAWAVAAIAVAAGAAGAAEAAAAVADDEDKTTVHKEKTNELKNTYYDFVENFCDRLRDR
jgi:hypothetical protein